MWVNGDRQWDSHVIGKTHRKNAALATHPQLSFSSDQIYWARHIARYHLQMLYTRFLVRSCRVTQ
eukprot:619361-Lingulodinium_polyedra.AAC.1